MKESEIRARIESLLRKVVLPAGIVAFAACAYGAPFDDSDAAPHYAAVFPDAQSVDQAAGDASDAISDGDPDSHG